MHDQVKNLIHLTNCIIFNMSTLLMDVFHYNPNYMGAAAFDATLICVFGHFFFFSVINLK